MDQKVALKKDQIVGQGSQHLQTSTEREAKDPGPTIQSPFTSDVSHWKSEEQQIETYFAHQKFKWWLSIPQGNFRRLHPCVVAQVLPWSRHCYAVWIFTTGTTRKKSGGSGNVWKLTHTIGACTGVIMHIYMCICIYIILYYYTDMCI